MAKHKTIKFGDILIIIILLGLSFLPVYYLTPKHTENTVIAVVKAKHKTVKTFNLSQDTKWTYHDGSETNTIVVHNHQIHIEEANCPDQVCVHEGWKSKPGQTIVCLPHQLIIELKSNTNNHTRSTPTKKKSNDTFDHTLVNP